MANDIRQIRELIGNDRLEAALDALLDLLDPREYDRDLLDQAILQKGRLADFRRKEIAGIENETDINKIRDALLKITRDLEKRLKEAPYTPSSEPVEPVRPPRRPDNPPPPHPPQYIAQCYFTGDLNQYLVLPSNQIMAVNPMTSYSLPVATRVASPNPAFAWVYQFPNGLYYNIDHNGAIWGFDAFGLPTQVGYVQYF